MISHHSALDFIKEKMLRLTAAAWLVAPGNQLVSGSAKGFFVVVFYSGNTGTIGIMKLICITV